MGALVALSANSGLLSQAHSVAQFASYLEEQKISIPRIAAME
jgi:hypothetical protein